MVALFLRGCRSATTATIWHSSALHSGRRQRVSGGEEAAVMMNRVGVGYHNRHKQSTDLISRRCDVPRTVSTHQMMTHRALAAYNMPCRRQGYSTRPQSVEQTGTCVQPHTQHPTDDQQRRRHDGPQRVLTRVGCPKSAPPTNAMSAMMRWNEEPACADPLWCLRIPCHG